MGGRDGDAEVEREVNRLTGTVIAAAIEVHRRVGPGLMESAYQACLAREFVLRGIAHQREMSIPVQYKGIALDCGYRIDFLVSDGPNDGTVSDRTDRTDECSILVELKSVRVIDPVHVAQVLTYLKCTRKRTGLLINFNVPLLKDGIQRIVNREFRPTSTCTQPPSR